MSSFKTSLLSQLGTKDEAREPAVEGSPFGERGGSAPHASASLEAPSRGLLLMIGNLGRTGRSAIGVIVTTWLCFGVASCVPTNRAEFEASAVGGDVGSVSCDGGRYAIQFSPPDLEDTALTVVAVAPRGIGDARVMLFIGKTGPSTGTELNVYVVLKK